MPSLLTVPGIVSCTRYQERGALRRYLAAYEIKGPNVFQQVRYREVAGWGEWAPFIVEWRKAVYEVIDDTVR